MMGRRYWSWTASIRFCERNRRQVAAFTYWARATDTIRI